MTTPSFTFDETAWQFACDKNNAAAKSAFDASEQAAFAKDNTHVVQTFVPKTVAQYVQFILDSCGESYAKQATKDATDVRLAKLLAQPQHVIDAIAAQVDAMPA